MSYPVALRRYRHACCLRGFTLVEAMIAIVIVLTLAALAVPSFRSMIANQQVSSAASELQVALLKVRSEATKRNANVTLSAKSGGWAAGWQILNPTDASLIEDHGAVNGVDVGGAGSVVYQGSGRVQGGVTVSLEIRSTALSTIVQCVVIDPAGRPKVKGESC